ncbi:MAG: transketolase [Ignavibacteria bacterium]|nr:transketolase [Ignavibacteria bacterium]
MADPTKTKKIRKNISGSNGNVRQGITTQNLTVEEILNDYRIAVESRQASYLGRREVLSGKAKFGIFGDGKEIAQVAMARAYKPGDWRSGYYRDQTFMFAIGESDVQKFFAQLYAHTDAVAEPSSAGRSMNGHFATRLLDERGHWLPQTGRYNVSADVSPTGSQMPRLIGLAYASRLYRDIPELKQFTDFSEDGNEVAFGTIGNASAAEGMFWETVNAIGVLQAPAVISIWDDGYGISVPNQYQHTKGNVGDLLAGFKRTGNGGSDDVKQGYDLHIVRGWDYPALLETYALASETARKYHVPQLIHVTEVTQPQGHSTSGSHERYKTPERLQWEKDFDGIVRMRSWMLENHIADESQIDEIDARAIETVRDMKQAAWDAYMKPIAHDVSLGVEVILKAASMQSQAGNSRHLTSIADELTAIREPFRRDVFGAIHRALMLVRSTSSADDSATTLLANWLGEYDSGIAPLYSSHLTSETDENAAMVNDVSIVYAADAPLVNGSEVMNACFRENLSRDPRIIAFGEDIGRLGDVNQGFAGLQALYGELRVSDVGIRECTIVGQAIGMAMRGLRPIAEIQYIDYLLYALQILSDDLATVQWRTKGGQKAPAIIRTRGHRLEGIWHSGSPMAGIINLVRGIHVCVPRNMTQAAGMYNRLLRSDEPAIIIEVLNGYRLKERLPSNPGEFTVPLGNPEILSEGTDVTLVTYGASCRVALDAAAQLQRIGISAEVIDVQTLLPFDTEHVIASSLRKTSRLVVLDEDVPGGASAFILQNVLEGQHAWNLLDVSPLTITAQEHRPAYGTDGNFWSKPEMERVVEAIIGMGEWF